MLMMGRANTITATIAVLLCLLHQGVSKDVTITDIIIPKQPHRNENVTLECKFDFKKTPTFIKWFYNDLEFLQFHPQRPENKINLLMEDLNITVNLNETTGYKVVLTQVDRNASGNYSCYIMGSFPNMHEDRKTKTMTVVEIPDDQPSIEGDVRDHFAVGDIVNLTCTTPPSFPAATLSWFINGDKAPKKFLHKYPLEMTSDRLYVSRLRLNFVLTTTHFIKGELRLKCVASIASLYTKTNEHSQQEPPSADEPPAKEVKNPPEEGSLVTTGTSGCTSVWVNIPHAFILQATLLITAFLLH